MELRNEDLSVTIDEPGRRYVGTRFDWTSQVSSVRLSDGTEFMSQEAPPGPFVEDKGLGLAGEFGIKAPIGYSDCAVGDWFPKIGVGWIRREDGEDYDFFYRYRELEAVPCTITHQDDRRVVLEMDSGLRRGYGWKLRRDWWLEGTNLCCATTLENRGREAFRTNEYSHNFVAPGGSPRRRELAFSWGKPRTPGKLINPDGNLELGPDGVLVDIGRGGEFYASELGMDLPAGSWWELRHDGRPWVKETLDAPATHCDLWGKSTVVSAELFIDLALEPGQGRTWTRRWSFGG